MRALVRRRRTRKAAGIIVVAVAGSLVPTTAARAEIACSISGTTVTVFDWGVQEGGDLTIRRNGSHFLFSSTDGTSSSCGATIANVDTVRVTRKGRITAEHVTIDLSGGFFGPGATAETSGTSEIEFQVHLGGCSCRFGGIDELEIVGTAEADAIRFAGGMIARPDATPGGDLNADGDIDVSVEDHAVLRTTLRGGEGNDTVAGAMATRLPYPGRLSVDGGSGDDTLVGGSADDRLVGGDGTDSLSGGHGADFFEESPGADTIAGGFGDDRFHGSTAALGPTAFAGEAGIDTVDYSRRETSVSVSLDGVAGDGAQDEGDDIGEDVENAMGGREGDVLVGSALDNYLNGLLGDDVLRGRGGADELDGDLGDDDVIGAGGDDHLLGGPGANELYGGGGSDRLETLTGGDRLAGGGGDDELAAGPGNDRLLGGAGGDRLEGSSGDDVLRGGAGDDDLEGGDGRDDCNGGEGADFSAACERPD